MSPTPMTPLPRHVPPPTADQRAVEQPAGSMLYALLRCRGAILAATLLGAAIGLVLGLMRANSFTSSGTLLLRSGARETASAESTVAGRETPDVRPFDFITNEIQILSHREAFHRVIEKVGVARILEVFDPAAEDSDETALLARGLHRLQTWWFATSSEDVDAASPERRDFLALKKLLTNLTLRASGSSVIRVSYEAHSPELAKEIVDAFLAAAEEHHRQVFSNRTSLEFLTIVEKQARAAARTANEALTAFKHEHGVFDLSLQRTAMIADLSRLETGLAADEKELRAHESRCESLRRLLTSVPPFEDGVIDGPLKENPEYAALQHEIVTLLHEQATIKGSGLDKADTQRRLDALNDCIAMIEERVRDVAPMAPAAGSGDKVRNPRYERLRELLDEDELRLVAFRAARDQQVRQLEDMRVRVRGLDEMRPCHDALVEEVTKHENDSVRFLESLKRAELLNLLDENKLSNLQILEAGDLPVLKSGPNRALWALIGAACGIMVGLCAALLRQRCNGSVLRAQDLEAAGAPVIGVVPEHKAIAAHDLREDASPDDGRDRLLRRRLDSLWAALLPYRIPSDFRCTIAMVGEQESVGVTTLALQLAARAASSCQLEVLMIETNHHHATLAGRQGLDGAPGLTELLAGTARRDDAMRPTAVPGLRIVHAGTKGVAPSETKAAEGTRGSGLEELLRSLAAGCQLMVLDVPSIVDHPEFRQVVACADLVVPVFAAGRSTKEGARALMQAIGGAGRRTPGAILNRWQSIRPFWLPANLDV